MAAWFDKHKHLYPANWTEIATAVKVRAGWRCLVCGVPHGPSPAVLTVHHLNHEPGDCADGNLLSCCQSCHLRIQALRPRPRSIEEAIGRMAEWVSTRGTQRSLLEQECKSERTKR